MIGEFGDSMSTSEYEGIKLHLHVYGRFGSTSDLEFDRKADAAGAKTCIILSIYRLGRVRDALGFKKNILKVYGVCYSTRCGCSGFSRCFYFTRILYWDFGMWVNEM